MPTLNLDRSSSIQPAKPARKSRKTATKTEARNFNKLAAAGDLPAVQRMIEQYPELATQSEAIVEASFHGHATVVQSLVDAGANPNSLSIHSHRYRPLHRAIESKKSVPKTADHLNVVRVLLENGADVQTRGEWCGVTPIALAAMGHEPGFLPLLMPYLDRWDLCTAAVLGETRHVATILKRDPTAATTPDLNNLTPLHYAAASRLGSEDPAAGERLKRIAEMLIAAGADVNAGAQVGAYSALPPIHFAAGNKSVLQTLIFHGADPFAALSPALWNGDYEIAEALVHAGASLKNKQAAEWVSDFTRWGHYPHAKWLIERGADVNGRTDDGRTALHWAVQRGASTELIRFLFDHGADVSLHDAEGNTALSLATSKRRTRLATLLQKHGATE